MYLHRNIASGDGGTQVNWMEMAAQVSEKLMEALEQLSRESQGVVALTDNDISAFDKRRELAIKQLQTVLEGFSVPDLVNIPAENQVTNIVLAEELMQELKELGLLKKNLNSNVGNLKDFIANRSERDANLVEIIRGLKQETEAIEDENDEEELHQLKRMKHNIREVLNTILDEAYPELKCDVKTIIHELHEARNDQDNPYVQVPESGHQGSYAPPHGQNYNAARNCSKSHPFNVIVHLLLLFLIQCR